MGTGLAVEPGTGVSNEGIEAFCSDGFSDSDICGTRKSEPAGGVVMTASELLAAANGPISAEDCSRSDQRRLLMGLRRAEARGGGEAD